MIYDEDGLKVEAVPNTHISPGADGATGSYSFIIRTNGKVIVYSGDINLRDFGTVLPDEFDMFICETGHHTTLQVCEALKEYEKKPKTLVFDHHGPRTTENMALALKNAEENFDGRVIMAEEGSTMELSELIQMT